MIGAEVGRDESTAGRAETVAQWLMDGQLYSQVQKRCQDRWNLTADDVYRLIDAAIKDLPPPADTDLARSARDQQLGMHQSLTAAVAKHGSLALQRLASQSRMRQLGYY